MCGQGVVYKAHEVKNKTKIMIYSRSPENYFWIFFLISVHGKEIKNGPLYSVHVAVKLHRVFFAATLIKGAVMVAGERGKHGNLKT
jgi:hypothetical protein